jgi:hypothetical protein
VKVIDIINDVLVDHQVILEEYDALTADLFGDEEWPNLLTANGSGISLRGADMFDNLDLRTVKHIDEVYERYSFWNEKAPAYTKATVDELSDVVKLRLTRVRYLRLGPGQGLPLHADPNPRFHYPIKTSPKAFFACVDSTETIENMQYEHLPINKHFYKLDTTRPHFVYNAGWEPRIHLVIS